MKSEARQRIEAAGIKYPAQWADMGSSQKDLWEDRHLASIAKAGDRQARKDALLADLSSNGRTPKMVRVRQVGWVGSGRHIHVIEWMDGGNEWRTICGRRRRVTRAPLTVAAATCTHCIKHLEVLTLSEKTQ